MTESTEKWKDKYPDIQIFRKNGRTYTKDSLEAGIRKFTDFGSDSMGPFQNSSPSFSMNQSWWPSGGGTFVPSTAVFRGGDGSYSPERSCEWLIANAKATSQHICATYVRLALEAGGLNTQGHPRWAYQYINWLPTVGFKCVGQYRRGDAFQFQKGDIAAYPRGNELNYPGHICMWTGFQWMSDFRQANCIVYKSTSMTNIFRYEAS